MNESKYRTLLETLKKDILGGKYNSGSSFPSIRALVRRHGLSKNTVQHAIDELTHQGLISRTQGRGTFVTREGAQRKLGVIVPRHAYSEIFPRIIGEFSRLAQKGGYTLLFGDVSSKDPVQRAKMAQNLAADFIRQGVAGVLYQPLSDVMSEPTSRSVREKKLKSMAMTGLVLDNASVITAMESKTEKLYIPAFINKDGLSDGSIVTAAQFDQLRRMTERLLVSMAETLVAGDIDARPFYKENSHDACKYCDFRAVCAREEGDPCRAMAAGDLKKALAETEGEDDASE